MGVGGLSGLIHSQDGFLKPHELKDSTVIIDGFNLVYSLYQSSKLDYRFGGDYYAFSEIVRAFFRNLQRCRIRPILIFDGSLDPERRKRRTHIQRFRNSISCIAQQLKGGSNPVLPLLALDVLLGVAVDELDVPVYKCGGEADNLIARIANSFHPNPVPVLTDDSDFFIFNLKAGVIPIRSLDWETVRNLQAGQYYSQSATSPSITPPPPPYISCKLYMVDNLIQKYPNLNVSILPYVAIVQGNDFVTAKTFERIMDRLPGKHPKNVRGWRRSKLNVLFEWVASFDGPEDIENTILNWYPTQERPRILDIMKQCLEDYDTAPISTPAGKSIVDHDAVFEVIRSSADLAKLTASAPKWLVDEYVKHVSMAYLTVPLHPTVWLSPLMEDMEQESCFEPALFIRRIMYGLIFGECDSRMKENWNGSSSSEPLPLSLVNEISRVGYSIKTNHVTPSGPKCVLSLSELPSLTPKYRQTLFLCLLFGKSCNKEQNSPPPPDVDLVQIAAFWWVTHAAVPMSHFFALLLSRFICDRAASRRSEITPTARKLKKKKFQGSPEAPPPVSIVENSSASLSSNNNSAEEAQKQEMKSSDPTPAAAGFPLVGNPFNHAPNVEVERLGKCERRRAKARNKLGVCVKTWHCFAQFQAVFLALRQLNALFGEPFEEIRADRVLSGPFLYNTAMELSLAAGSGTGQNNGECLSTCLEGLAGKAEMGVLDKALLSDLELINGFAKSKKSFVDAFNFLSTLAHTSILPATFSPSFLNRNQKLKQKNRLDQQRNQQAAAAAAINHSSATEKDRGIRGSDEEIAEESEEEKEEEEEEEVYPASDYDSDNLYTALADCLI